MSADPLELALRYLNRRERTASEVRRYLLDREVRPGSVEATIEELSKQGFLDDARFARLFAQDKRALERWGNERIRQGLLARGVERELVDATLADADADDAADSGPDGHACGELQRALELLRVRFPCPPRDRRERERALGVLLRKGYEPELALDALSGYARQHH